MTRAIIVRKDAQNVIVAGGPRVLAIKDAALVSSLLINARNAVDQAEAAAAEAAASAATFDELLTYVPATNLASPATLVEGKYMASNGTIVSDAAWSSWLIPVEPGVAYTWWSDTTRRVGSGFMSDPTTYISSTYSSAATAGGIENAITRTTHASAAYVWINRSSNTITPPDEFMMARGSVALPYEAWHEPVPYVPLSSVLFDVPLPTPDYVVTVPSNNLYDKDDTAIRKDGQYLDNSGNMASAAGWAHGRIPAAEGDTFTLGWSGSKRQGVAFYASDEATSPISGSYNSATGSPLTVTAPAGTAQFRFNVQSSTVSEPADLMVNAGGVALPYEAPGERQMIDPDYLNSGEGGAAKLVLSTSTAKGTTLLSTPLGDQTLWQAISPTLPTLATDSDVFNFHSMALGDTAQTSNGADDVAPAHIMDWTIGANHGWVGTNLTHAAHGKTAADIGSIYAEGGVQWKIWNVPSANVITVTAVEGNAAYTGTTLTHVSGGTNTGSITPSAKNSTSIFPVITNHAKAVSVDGAAVEAPGTFYPKSNVIFSESYNIPDKDTLVAGSPTDRASLSMTYRFDIRGGCTISADFLALDDIADFQDLMFLQCYPLAANGGVLEYLIPDTAPFSHGGNDYDFSKGEDMSGALANALLITPTRIADPDIWPSRVIQINGDIGFAVGFLPYGDAADDVRPTRAASQALEVRDGTKKIYMHAINNSSTTSLAAGDYFSVVGYRVPFALHTNRTACYVVEGPDADWLFVDWHASIVDQIELPPLLHGRAFTAYRKTDGVTIYGAQATDSVRAAVTTSAGAGQYAILRFAR